MLTTKNRAGIREGQTQGKGEKLNPRQLKSKDQTENPVPVGFTQREREREKERE